MRATDSSALTGRSEPFECSPAPQGSFNLFDGHQVAFPGCRDNELLAEIHVAQVLLQHDTKARPSSALTTTIFQNLLGMRTTSCPCSLTPKKRRSLLRNTGPPSTIAFLRLGLSFDQRFRVSAIVHALGGLVELLGAAVGGVVGVSIAHLHVLEGVALGNVVAAHDVAFVEGRAILIKEDIGKLMLFRNARVGHPLLDGALSQADEFGAGTLAPVDLAARIPPIDVWPR